MKVAVMSDLHLECDLAAAEHGASGAPLDLPISGAIRAPLADFVVLAGDIHVGSQAFDWSHRHFAIPTILIAGNHESFGRELFRTIAFNRRKSNDSDGRTIFLERGIWQCQSIEGERARVIGATLWTDFKLYGTPIESMEYAEKRLDDFKIIKIERGYRLRALQPSDTVRLHCASLTFLRQELERPFEGPTVVVTHHAPSARSVAPQFLDDPLSPAFASNLEELIATYEPELWVHGHVHESFDYMVGRTRIVCNPRGYFPNGLNPNFDPAFVVHVQKH